MKADAKKIIMTQEGIDALEAELEDLKVNKMTENAEKLKEARAQGDLSENAEYDAAKDEQAAIHARIEELQEILKHVEKAGEDESTKDTVAVGNFVKVLDVEFNEEVEYSIVGSSESDVFANKISNESPVGAALIGKRVGDTVNVETANGELQFKVLEIRKN